jgi:hypothetical protein
MYKQNDFLYVIKLNPGAAHKKIKAAIDGVDEAETGRTMELAAKALGFTSTTLKRYVKLLEDQGFTFEIERKPRADKVPAKPAKKAGSKKKATAA